MMKLKRVVSLVLALVILALSLPVFSVFAADGDMRYGRTKLNADLQYIYDALVSGCESAKPEIKVDISGRSIDLSKELDKVYTMFYGDYPEYFWITGGWDASFDGIVLTVKPHYSIPGGNLSVAKSKYNGQINALTSGLNGSDYNKAKILHDRLIDHVEYVSAENDQNAYGALVEGKAVCNGYTRAYQHLMNKVGIPAWYVAGASVNPATSTSIAHAWNLVKLDGDWYYTDVTWDDQGENTFYAYFNITTDQLLKDHVIHSDYTDFVPHATATGANYYNIENRQFTGYDQNRLVDLLKKDGRKTQIYINGNVADFIASVNANLLSIGEQLGGTGAFQISYGTLTLGNALILDFALTSESHAHKPQTSVQQVNATCQANGTRAYYICDCGIKFLDAACTKQIINDSELTIPANVHTPSNFKYNDTDHWKECTQCGCEIANTRSAHRDGNGDNQCDTCAYALPVINEGGNTAVGGNTTGNNNGDSSNNEAQPGPETGDNNTSTVPDESVDDTGGVGKDTTGESQPDDNETSPGGDETQPDDSETIFEDGDTTPDSSGTASDGNPTSDPEETVSDIGAQSGEPDLKPVFILGAAVVVIAGIAAMVISFRKKKS